MNQFQNKGFQNAPPKQGHVPEGGQRLVEIAKTLDYRASFQPVRRGAGTAYYVTMYKPGNSCLGRRQVGRLDVLVALSDEDVQAAIVAAFAPKGRS